MLVVRRNDPLVPSNELIIVPHSVLHGLVTALHIKLDHPLRHQLELVMKRHFYALDLTKAIERTYNSCHTCLTLQKFPDSLVKQTSEDPPESIAVSFAADILKRDRQLILLLRKTVTSYTAACIISYEKQTTLREASACLATELHPLDGPPAVIRVDSAPGFMASRNDETTGFSCWFSSAPVFQWCCSTPQGSPGVGRNTFLSSPHLCFIIVFICDLFVSRDDPLMS